MSVLHDFSAATSALAKEASTKVVSVRESHGAWASGVILEGHVVTTSHPFDREDQIRVVVSGEEKPAQVVGFDNRFDLAVLKVDGLNESGAWTLAGESSLGELVFALGMDGDTPRFHSGVVAKFRERWTTSLGGELTPDLEVDGTLTHTMNGGPLVNTKGELLGINSLLPRGRGMTVPAATVVRIVKAILEHGTPKPGFLGVSVTSAKADEGAAVLVITAVAEASPASKAGLKVGDVAIRIGGRDFSSAESFYRHMRTYVAGETIELTVRSGSEERMISVTLDQRR